MKNIYLLRAHHHATYAASVHRCIRFTSVVMAPSSHVQLFNSNNDLFFLNTETEEGSWTLPRNFSLSYITHINDGKYYYENVETGSVAWALELSSGAAARLMAMDRDAMESDFIAHYDAEVSALELERVDAYVEAIQNGTTPPMSPSPPRPKVHEKELEQKHAPIVATTLALQSVSSVKKQIIKSGMAPTPSRLIILSYLSHPVFSLLSSSHLPF